MHSLRNLHPSCEFVSSREISAPLREDNTKLKAAMGGLAVAERHRRRDKRQEEGVGGGVDVVSGKKL